MTRTTSVGIFICCLLWAAAGCGNAAPTVEAGEDQNALVGEPFELAPRGKDPDGKPLTYEWFIVEAPAGSQTELEDPTEGRAVFVPDTEGDYLIEVQVSDGELRSSFDDILITARNPPTAVVADPGPVAVGATVTLDGSASTVGTGGTLSYQWELSTVPEGSAAELSAADVASPSFVADLAGDYEVTLVINDGEFDGAPTTLTITAS